MCDQGQGSNDRLPPGCTAQVLEDLAASGASEQQADELTYGEILPGEFKRLLATHARQPVRRSGTSL